jgi:O-acetyl-ADP-ribose deacetylase
MAPGFNLPARYVTHAVGPVWRGGARSEVELLASCYRRSIESAREFESLAFPATSTGIYGFPAPQAKAIAVAATKAALVEAPNAIRRTLFCCFSETSADALGGRTGSRRTMT